MTENKTIHSAGALVSEVNSFIIAMTGSGNTKRQHSMFPYSLFYDSLLNSYDSLHCYVYMPEQNEKYVETETKKSFYCLQLWHPNYHK